MGSSLLVILLFSLLILLVLGFVSICFMAFRSVRVFVLLFFFTFERIYFLIIKTFNVMKTFLKKLLQALSPFIFEQITKLIEKIGSKEVDNNN